MLSGQSGSSRESLSRSSPRGTFPEPQSWRLAALTLVSPGVGGPPQTPEPPNSTQGPGCWWGPLQAEAAFPKATLWFRQFKRMFHKRLHLPRPSPLAQSHRPSEPRLAQSKCHTDLLRDVAQQLTPGTDRGVTPVTWLEMCRDGEGTIRGVGRQGLEQGRGRGWNGARGDPEVRQQKHVCMLQPSLQGGPGGQAALSGAVKPPLACPPTS